MGLQKSTAFSTLISVLFSLIQFTTAVGNCQLCKDISKNFEEGLKNTAKSNFGGGNTKWEESRLGSYATSETRLVEVIDNLCSGQDKKCHTYVEENEELVEEYWFKVFSKRGKDIYTWLCIEKVKECCPENTFGPKCDECVGGKEKPCSGNGKCEGGGTREGTGKCICDTGYHGDICDLCNDNYFSENSSDGSVKCTACHESCASTCWEAGPKGCDECKKGWQSSEEDGCQDMDECSVEVSPCSDGQYCTNTPGSFYCATCHNACRTCSGYGNNKCTECKEGYTMKDEACQDINECETEGSETVCPGANRKCINNEGSYGCECMDGFIEEEGFCIPKPKNTIPQQSHIKDAQNILKNPKKKGKISQNYFKDKPSLFLFFGVLVAFALLSILIKGDIVLVSILVCFTAYFLYWYSSQFDKYG